MQELLGRIVSFAGLTYFSDTSDPQRAKFYGDIQSKVTDTSSRLLFFTLELNRIEDAVIDTAMQNDPDAAHYAPWLTDLRKDRPYQLEDRVEQLFTKNRSPVMAPGIACSTKPCRRCALRSTAKN